MIPLYWVAFGAGLVALIFWILARGLADGELLTRFDPEVRFPRAKLLVAGTLGFGMAGLSSSYAGWPGALSILGAVAGALASAWYAHRIEEETVSGPVSDNSSNRH